LESSLAEASPHQQMPQEHGGNITYLKGKMQKEPLPTFTNIHPKTVDKNHWE